MMDITVTPGAGRIAVVQLDLTQEIEFYNEAERRQMRLKVISSENQEGLVARVIANCKPWSAVSAPEHIFNPEYDVDDIVVIGRWTGTRISIDRLDFIVLREEDVLCKLSRKPNLLAPTMSDETIESDPNNPVDAAATI